MILASPSAWPRKINRGLRTVTLSQLFVGYSVVFGRVEVDGRLGGEGFGLGLVLHGTCRV